MASTDPSAASSLGGGLAGLMDEYPELSNCILTAFLWSLGDLLAQLLEFLSLRRSTHLPLPQSSAAAGSINAPLGVYGPSAKCVWNVARTARLALFAGIFFAPLTKAWFELLVLLFPGHGLAVAAQRMLADQLLYAPLMIGCLFCWTGLSEGGWALSGAVRKLQASWWSALKSNWLLWPLAQLLIQGVVPLQWRMAVAALINIPWCAYLSWTNGGGVVTPQSPVGLGTRK